MGIRTAPRSGRHPSGRLVGAGRRTRDRTGSQPVGGTGRDARRGPAPTGEPRQPTTIIGARPPRAAAQGIGTNVSTPELMSPGRRTPYLTYLSVYTMRM